MAIFHLSGRIPFIYELIKIADNGIENSFELNFKIETLTPSGPGDLFEFNLFMYFSILLGPNTMKGFMLNELSVRLGKSDRVLGSSFQFKQIAIHYFLKIYNSGRLYVTFIFGTYESQLDENSQASVRKCHLAKK